MSAPAKGDEQGDRRAAGSRPTWSANADWVRALQRTADVTTGSTRTLAAVVQEKGAAQPLALALLGDTAALTYAELSSRANQYARWALAQAFRPGDRVALMMENEPDYAAIWIGLSGVGIVTALINTHLVGAGLRHCVAVAAARHVIVGGSCLPAFAAAGAPGDVPVSVHGASTVGYPRIDALLDGFSPEPLAADARPEVTLGDDALLIFTSGTTGLPKAARVSHYRVMMWSEWFAGITDARADDRLYDCLPMYHSVGGVVAIGSMLVAGGSVIVRRSFSASRFWSDVAASGATIFQYIGELCRYLLNAPPDEADRSHRLRLCIGNGLRADVWQAFERRFAVPRIIEFYAATEGSFSLFNLEGRRGAIGRIPRFIAHRSPVALVRVDVESNRPVRTAAGFCMRCEANEPGEAIGLIATDGSSLSTRFEGYTSEAESARKILRDVFAVGDAWFRTGDLMARDAEGFYRFVDRIGDTFRWKGENVATAEVADALCACEGVLEAIVYGIDLPHGDGRAGMAALVVTPAFDVERLRTQLEGLLPRYARPMVLRLCGGLETTGTFKVRKGELAAEGCDPRVVADPLYLDDPVRAAYRPLDGALFDELEAGAIRL